MIKNFVTVLMLFLYVYGIPFHGIPFNTSKIVFLFLIVFYIFGKKIKKTLKQEVFAFFLFFGLLFFISLFFPLLYGTGDYSIPYAYFILIFEAGLGSYLFVNIFFVKKDLVFFFDAFIKIAFLQSVIIVLMLFDDSFRGYIYSITDLNAEQLKDRYGGFRGFGLASSVTYDLSLFLSFSLVFISYILVEKKKHVIKYYFYWVFIFVAILMTGRSGWFGVLFSLFYLLYKQVILFRLFSLVKQTVYFFVMAAVIIPFVKLNYPSIYSFFTEEIYAYAFEMFINYSESGRISTSSSDVLNEMYFPVSLLTFLGGDGRYLSGDGFGYYMGTDAGYMRHLLYYGIFPSVLLYISYFYGFFQVYKRSLLFRAEWVVVMIAICYYLAHYKGDFFVGSSMNIKLYAMLFMFFVYKSGVNPPFKPQYSELECTNKCKCTECAN